MEEHSVLISVPLEEADAIVSHAVTDWRWGACRLSKEVQTKPEGIKQITGCYELKDRGVSDRYILETRAEEREDGVLVSWCYPGKGEELMMASPQLIDFLQIGIAKALRPYQKTEKSSAWSRLFGC